MGIKGLIKFVDNAVNDEHISHFANQTAVVDISCWLHKGLFSCAHAMALGERADGYITYCLNRVQLLLKHNIRVILVFDGSPLPAKEATNAERSVSRELHKAKARQLIAAQKYGEAGKALQRATEITWDVVKSVIRECRRLPNVDVIVSPYESDAQMAYLCQTGYADFCITEDSDLVVFGVQHIVFKLETTGQCQRYDRSRLPACLPISFRLDRKAQPSTENNFDFVKFRRMCILSGCDYLPVGLPGVGLNKSRDFFAKTSNSQKDLTKILRQIPTYLNLKRNAAANVTEEFIRMFDEAEKTFLHQVVYDPIDRRRRPLNDYDSVTSNGLGSQGSSTSNSSGDSATPPERTTAVSLHFAGRLDLSPKKSSHLAMGNRNPRTMQRTEGATLFSPEIHSHASSIWRCKSLADLKKSRTTAHAKGQQTLTIFTEPTTSAFTLDTKVDSPKQASKRPHRSSTSSKGKEVEHTMWSEEKLLSTYYNLPASENNDERKKRRASLENQAPSSSAPITAYFQFQPPAKGSPAVNPFKVPRPATRNCVDDIVEIDIDEEERNCVDVVVELPPKKKPSPKKKQQFFRASKTPLSPPSVHRAFKSPRQQLSTLRRRSKAISLVEGEGREKGEQREKGEPVEQLENSGYKGDVDDYLQTFHFDAKAVGRSRNI